MTSPAQESSPDALATRRPGWPLWPVWMLGNGFAWLGGASWRALDDRHERSSYQVSGFFVLLNGFIAWGLATFAAVGMELTQSFGAAAPFVAVWGLFVIGFDRAICAVVFDPARRTAARRSYLARAICAGLLGFMISEMGALAIFEDDINRTMNDSIAAQVEASRKLIVGADGQPTDRAQQLAKLRTDRAKLDTDVANATTAAKQAGLVAVCERQPAGCPPDLVKSGQISGRGGDGGLTRQRDADAAKAQAELTRATTAQTNDGPKLDSQISALDKAVQADLGKADALAKAEDGLAARWHALLKFAFSDGWALGFHIMLTVFFILLDLVPLFIKIGRGRTRYDSTVVHARNRHIKELEFRGEEHAKQQQARLDRVTLEADLEGDVAKLQAQTTRKIEEERQRVRLERELAKLAREPVEEEPSEEEPVEDDPVEPEGPAPAEAEDAGAGEPQPYDTVKIPHNWDMEDRELLGRVFGGQYQAIEPLNSADAGGFGRMLRGREVDTDREVAIKAVRDEAATKRRLFRTARRRMWQREVEAARRLQHSNIGEILNSGVDRQWLWTASPLYTPGSLVNWIANATARGRIGYTLGRTAEYIGQLADALEYAHSNNVSHGDIKPTNAVLDGPLLVLVDWGFARVFSAADRNEVSSAGGGTPNYTAPEALLGDKDDPELGDLYSIGATWYYLLTGQAPHQEAGRLADKREQARRIRSGETTYTPLDQLLPNIPRDVAGLVHTLLSPEPAARVVGQADVRPATGLKQAVKAVAREIDNSGQAELVVGATAVRLDRPAAARPASTELESGIISVDVPTQALSGPSAPSVVTDDEPTVTLRAYNGRNGERTIRTTLPETEFDEDEH
ncbi:DUF4407 domain-containing protein [Amycolatopsis sp. NPDC005961]|uniref:DUF4407 domain-containing protein n=1 Tax=Amycolatopsis sp. NPDC005961 TaxID=3156720 RepID=UPI0033F9266A